MLKSEELINKVKNYNKFLNPETLTKAYDFALKAHEKQKRDEGSPYIIHPIAVANILTELLVKIWNERLNKKSITAISIVCHEIGHAIQHAENYKPLEQRNKIVKNTAWITSIGSGILYMGIPTIFATGATSLIKVCLIITLLSMIIGVLIHLITLDVEFDASFNKALPILKEKVPKEYHNACRSILLAAAFTYVIGTIKNFLSLRYIWLLLTRLR